MQTDMHTEGLNKVTKLPELSLEDKELRECSSESFHTKKKKKNIIQIWIDMSK